MNVAIEQQVLKITGASSISKVELVQSLWSDFGALERVWLKDVDQKSIVIKRIQPPSKMQHPRGWNTHASSKRKIRSYDIERRWYEMYAGKLPDDIKVPKFLFHFEWDGKSILGIEDLLDSGFILPYGTNEKCFNRCLEWLAKFHAFHMNSTSEGLWEVGTYWHLDTRWDEWRVMKDKNLKDAAEDIDKRLRQCNYQTLVHGDAKPANFLFSSGYEEVAAVDFQYVGRGCGMKDLIYLMSSALSENQMLNNDLQIVEQYFDCLQKAIIYNGTLDIDFAELKLEWKEMYQLAWADFVRFLDGWSPNHSRLNTYAWYQVEKLFNNDQS